jgi:hypothetical protein
MSVGGMLMRSILGIVLMLWIGGLSLAGGVGRCYRIRCGRFGGGLRLALISGEEF